MMIADVLIASACGAAGWAVPREILLRRRLACQARMSTRLLARAARMIGDGAKDRMALAGDLEAARDEIDRLRETLRQTDALAAALMVGEVAR